MTFFFYGICILGVVLGGLVLLVLYSLLVMARRADDCLDQLGLEMIRHYNAASSIAKRGKSENLRVRVTPDLYHGDIN